jgi:hypothetical protein
VIHDFINDHGLRVGGSSAKHGGKTSQERPGQGAVYAQISHKVVGLKSVILAQLRGFVEEDILPLTMAN